MLVCRIQSVHFNCPCLQAIKKVLEQNFEIDENMQSQALLFKSLWLEAEAKLCSMSYKARFEIMKAQMEEIKLKALKGT